MTYIKRDIEDKIMKWLEEREILAIRGPRQSGKTTMLKRIQEYLIKGGIPESRIHYITFEDDLIRLKFEENPKEFINSYLLSNEKHYFLLDEVQYVKNIGKTLKLIFDTYDNIKLIITGSSSFDLLNIGSLLVGRIIFFELYPFSFLEFLRSKGKRYERIYSEIRIDWNNLEKELKDSIFISELNTFLNEYLRYGSFPRIVLEEDKSKKKELLRNLFITYIEKDVMGKYGIKYRDKVINLLKVLASTVTRTVKYEDLSIHSGLKYYEIKEILPLLEDSFVISIVRPYFKNLRNELRKNPKIYFIDYGIESFLNGSIENPLFGILYENFVYNELKRHFEVKYWRTTTKSEVDFIIDLKSPIPVEVKTKAKLTRPFKSFISHYNSNIGIIANLNVVKEDIFNGCKVKTVPFSLLFAHNLYR